MSMRKRWYSPGLAYASWGVALSGYLLATSTLAQSTEAELTPKQQEQYAALAKSLSGAALVGHFTDSNSEPGNLKAERYELKEVRHLGKNQWLIQARIRYGEHDLTVPLTLPIRWAGDTPVITVNQVPIPGLGTFDARVMIFADHYAGFWSGGDHGGHLFGKIERKTDQEDVNE